MPIIPGNASVLYQIRPAAEASSKAALQRKGYKGRSRAHQDHDQFLPEHIGFPLDNHRSILSHRDSKDIAPLIISFSSSSDKRWSMTCWGSAFNPLQHRVTKSIKIGLVF